MDNKIHSLDNESRDIHKNKITIQTQTESDDNDIEIACKICIYEAVCVAELGWHLQSAHGIGDPDYEYNFSCKICKKPFDIKSDLMFHVKNEHSRSMPVCRYFQNDECKFADDKCWYTHKKESPTLNQYKCGICGKVFDTKNNFMVHRKMEHTPKVKQCINYKNEKCIFKDQCWYIHFDDTEESFSEY